MKPARDEIPALPVCRCGASIPGNVTLCVVCAENVGFPNVRYAERTAEVAALEKRLADARISASARGSSDRLEAFGMAVDVSKAVISRRQDDLDDMLKGDGRLMQAYHPAVRAGLRNPQNNEFDPLRDTNDGWVSPHFYDKLHFGALSLDGRGVPHYGEFSITLREDRTATRTNVFEENPLTFEDKHVRGRRGLVPFGYRAIWRDRSKLAMAKLHSKIDPETMDAEFPEILMERDTEVGGFSDFIEVHVYGDLHPRAFEHVIAEISSDETDSYIWNRMKSRLVALDISVEERSS